MAASETSFSSSDPTSSLRAAALSTIKRRKQPPADTPGPSGKTLPARPPPVSDNSVQLDYGQEDPPSSSTQPEQTRKTAQPEPPTSQVEQSQGREEGEISDSEDSPPVPTGNESRHPAPVSTSLPPKPGRLTLAVGRPSNRMEVTPPRSAIPKVESPAMHNLMDRISDLPTSMKNSYLGTDSSLLEETLSQLDVDHVRPGLAMTQAQYDIAKDIVLDLLGWGVAPEFLVDCGLSREIIFYVFSELRLRLPMNLDTSGLVPYPPDPQILSMPLHRLAQAPVRLQPSPVIKSESGTLTELKLNAAHSPPAVLRKVAGMASSAAPASGAGPSGSLPSQVAPSISTPPVVPTPESTSSPLSGNLHDMERQRRQELLARKAAAQASRRSKLASAAAASPVASTSRAPGADDGKTPNTSVGDAKEKQAQVTPTLSVDDFLNSIAPTSSNDTSNDMMIEEPSRRHASPETMDVDDPPGVAEADRTRSNIIATDQSLGTGDSLPPPTSPAEPPPSSADTGSVAPSSGPTRVTKSFADMQATLVLDHTNLHNGRAQTGADGQARTLTRSGTGSSFSSGSVSDLNQHAGTGNQRRGTKRPVAADFVDFDSSEGQNRRAQWSSATATIHATSINNDRTIRRKLTGMNGNSITSGIGGFASVSGMRRCVIDLSDSDGEADGDEDRGFNRARYSPAVVGARSGAVVAHSGRATPTASAPAALPQVSPSELIEKEEEIRKMREMIAQREQKRLQKLVMSRSMSAIPDASRAATPSVDASTTANATTDGQTEQKTNPEVESSDASMTTMSKSRSSGVTGSPTIDHGKTEASSVVILSNAQDRVPDNEEVPRSMDGSKQSGTTETMSDDADARDSKEIGITDSVDASPKIPSTQLGSAIRVLPGLEENPSSSSDKIEDSEGGGAYTTYESPFGRYPLLRSNIYLCRDDSWICNSTIRRSPPLSPSPPSLDLEPLRLATWLKTIDPLQQICQYQVPGGGVCRDSGCPDVHLQRMEQVELSDDDVARYIFERLPCSWQVGEEEEEVKDALQGQGSGKEMIDERVQRALRVLYERRRQR